MSINFDYYRIFCYVARYGSITQAANALGSSQPNVTRCMNNLESELGCRLFFRSNRGVTLSTEGELLYSHISEACDQLESAEANLSGIRKLELGSVTIGATESALHILLLERLRRFHDVYPHIHLCISYLNAPQALAALRNGQIDIAAVATPSGATHPLYEVPLMSFQDILIGSPRFAALSRRSLTLQEVSAYPLICMEKDTMTFQFYDQLFKDAGLVLKPDIIASNIDQILPLVKSDLGLGFLPEPLARESLSRGEVIPLSLAQALPSRQICLVKDRLRPLSTTARALEKVLLDDVSPIFPADEKPELS